MLSLVAAWMMLGAGCVVDFKDGFPKDGATDGLPDDVLGCVDEDGDGFGAGCAAGPDCDDHARGIVGPCQVNGCPQGWVLVPAGSFQMGCSAGDECWREESAESPRHEVTLPSFCMMPFEVPVAGYRKCLTGGVCAGQPKSNLEDTFCNWTPVPLGQEHHPINCVAWQDAQTFCRDWLGGDLPSEAEWEKAARGTEGHVYPWGDAPQPNCDLCNYDTNGGDPSGTKGCAEAAVGPATWNAIDGTQGVLGASPYGLRDMAGNVYEWVLDCYDPDFYNECAQGCESPVNLCADVGQRVIRGGAFSTTNSDYLRTVWRGSLSAQDKVSAVGFRCRRAVP
jgi:formylglycine-generating enzyme required for sulfatase activity